MSKPTLDETMKRAELVVALVNKQPEPRKALLNEMMAGPIGAEFMVAPASARVEHHCCFEGGLVFHSLNVVKNLRKIASCMAPCRWTEETLTFCGLFHDLGKVGDGERPYYVQNTSDWHLKKGIRYDYDKKCKYMPVQERSLFLLQKSGITMSEEEYLAIRLHDGMYLDENRVYAMREPDFALLISWADRWSTSEEKEAFGVDP